MQYFLAGKCKLCGREFRGLKASNGKSHLTPPTRPLLPGKRHLEMKHPAEYQQVLERKIRSGLELFAARKSISTVCSSTDDDDLAAAVPLNEEEGMAIDEDSYTPTSTSRPSAGEFDEQIKECVIALEAAARPLRRLSLFAGTCGIGAEFVENKHLRVSGEK
jgi:hypothetical protein